MSLPASKKTYWYVRSQTKIRERQMPDFRRFLNFPGIGADFRSNPDFKTPAELITEAFKNFRERQQEISMMFRTPEQQEAERKQWVEETQEPKKILGASAHIVAVDEIQNFSDRTVDRERGNGASH